VLLSGLEALLFLYFTLKVIVKRKARILSMILKDPNLSFCLVFSIIFAFAVGITSYNFGALSRYKIPCLPFYAVFLLVVYNLPDNNLNNEVISRKVHLKLTSKHF
jgi:hypothetical protein